MAGACPGSPLKKPAFPPRPKMKPSNLMEIYTICRPGALTGRFFNGLLAGIASAQTFKIKEQPAKADT
jgi:hypothetical protein